MRISDWSSDVCSSDLTKKAADKFEQDFWKSDDIDRFHDLHGRSELPSAKVFSAGVTEWRRPTKGNVIDRDGTRDRLSTALSSAVASEVAHLSARFNDLAPLGSVAHFVGVFGNSRG